MTIEFSPGLCIPGDGGTAEVDIADGVATVTVKEGDGTIVGHGLYRFDPESGKFELEAGTAWHPGSSNGESKPVSVFERWWRKWRRP